MSGGGFSSETLAKKDACVPPEPGGEKGLRRGKWQKLSSFSRLDHRDHPDRSLKSFGFFGQGGSSYP